MMGRGIRQFFPATQDIIQMALTLALPPGIFFYELFYILPAVDESIIHIFMAYFLLHNVVGNTIYGILTGPWSFTRNNKIINQPEDWRWCTKCDRRAPPRSWHCDVCGICILKRDHHCNFFGQCIGYFNHRYFLMFVFHVFLSTSYAFCFNFIFMIHHFRWDAMSWISLAKFVFPLAGLAFHFSEESFHVFYFVITLVIMLFTGFLLIHHGRILLRGQITPESKKEFLDIYNLGWKSNIIEVLGDKWYLVWISPFIPSKLPGDGIYWNTRDGCESVVKSL